MFGVWLFVDLSAVAYKPFPGLYGGWQWQLGARRPVARETSLIASLGWGGIGDRGGGGWGMGVGGGGWGMGVGGGGWGMGVGGGGWGMGVCGWGDGDGWMEVGVPVMSGHSVKSRG